MPAILPSTLTGAYRYLRSGLVDKRAVALTAPTAAIATVGGALTTRRIDGHILMLMTAGTLFVLALRSLPGKGNAPEIDAAPVAHPAGLIVLGLITGFFSGLLGIGGGFLMVPVFIRVFHMPLKTSLGTSLAVISLIVVPNLVTQAYVGNIDWTIAALLAIGVVPGAWLGASLAIKASDERLRIVVAICLALVAIMYAATESIALFSS